MASAAGVLAAPRRILRSISATPHKSAAASAFWRSLRSRDATPLPLGRHLDATCRWLCAAQDVGPDDGAAGWYDLKTGWEASYPETTGYIIPSFLAYARATGDAETAQRALRMADWEVDIQMPEGAVSSSVLGSQAVPAVFNTGQVLFGWTAAWRVSSDEHYREAARKAADWLVAVQDADGAWRKFLSGYVAVDVCTYNVRAAWALGQAGVVFGEPRWVEAARKNCEWTLGQQDASGWFAHNAFRRSNSALLHTICYVIEGLFGMGTLVGERRYADAARRAADSLVARVAADGRTCGMYASGWVPTVSWRCLTGDAQLAGALLRFGIYESAPPEYASLAANLLDSLCALQDMNPRHRPTCGGIPGSQPIWGDYLKYRYPNWAAKFHMDALLLALHHEDPHANPH